MAPLISYVHHNFNMALVLSGILTIVFVVCVFIGVAMLVMGIRWMIYFYRGMPAAEMPADESSEVKP